METRPDHHNPFRSLYLCDVAGPHPRSEHYNTVIVFRGQVHKDRRTNRILSLGRWNCWHIVRAVGSNMGQATLVPAWDDLFDLLKRVGWSFTKL
jgi:hypothetical protein